jgi:hypothetical protein
MNLPKPARRIASMPTKRPKPATEHAAPPIVDRAKQRRRPTQVKPVGLIWTAEEELHDLLGTFPADDAGISPSPRHVVVLFGGRFTKRQEIAEALRKMAVLIDGPQGQATLVTENL